MKNIWISIIKPKGFIANWLLFLSLIGIVYLSAAGHLDYLKELTDTKTLSFTVGDNQISLYRVMQAIFIVILTFWSAAIISDVVEKRVNKLNAVRAANRSLLLKVIQIGIYIIAFILALNMIGIDLTTLTVFSGAIGIGLGFGLQKIASNFISGIILLWEKSIEQDDLIEMSDGTFGFIRKAKARFTLVETLDGKEIMIPNEDFITNRVINWTYTNPKGRVQISLGVSYDCDIEKAHALILEAASEHPRCITDPAPNCFLRGFGDSSVDFILHFWVADVSLGRWNAESDVLFSIWKKFAENNIEIPYPQRDLHIKDPEFLKALKNIQNNKDKGGVKNDK